MLYIFLFVLCHLISYKIAVSSIDHWIFRFWVCTSFKNTENAWTKSPLAITLKQWCVRSGRTNTFYCYITRETLLKLTSQYIGKTLDGLSDSYFVYWLIIQPNLRFDRQIVSNFYVSPFCYELYNWNRFILDSLAGRRHSLYHQIVKLIVANLNMEV